MAIISAGYDGTVDEVQFAGMLPKAGASEYGVDGSGDFKVTITTGAARAVSIAPGTAWGHSVVDKMDTNFTVQFDEPTSGTRYDMVVLRRNWQPPGGSTSIEVVKGGTRADTLPTRNNIPGVLDDQPLALVALRAGDANALSVRDLRCWGRNGGLYARSPLVLQYLDRLGSVVAIDPDVDGAGIWFRMLNATGSAPAWYPLHRAVNITELFDGDNADLSLGRDNFGSYVKSIAVSDREYQSPPNMYITSNGVIGRAMRNPNRIDNGPNRAYIRAAGGTGKDAYIESGTIYGRTYSNAPNLYITSNGIIGRSTEQAATEAYVEAKVRSLEATIAGLMNRVRDLERK